MTCVAPLDAVGCAKPGCKANTAKLCLLVITLLRITSNFYWGEPVKRYFSRQISLVKDSNCECHTACRSPDPGGAERCNYSKPYTGDCEANEARTIRTWGYCWNPPFDPDRANEAGRAGLGAMYLDMWPITPADDSPDYVAIVYVIDFLSVMTMLNYLVRPLISALGVYIFLSRPERWSAQSRLQVWCYRSVLWLFVTSLFTDETITVLHAYSVGVDLVTPRFTGSLRQGLYETIHYLTSHENLYSFWSPYQTVLFACGITVSNLLQMHTANLKLQCLLWNRLAVFAKFLAAALLLAGVGGVVGYIDHEFGPCNGYGLPDTFDPWSCHSQLQNFLLWIWVCLSLMGLLGPVQSVGMWRVACTAVHASDWDEIRSEFLCLCASAFLTMVGTPLSASLVIYGATYPFAYEAFEIFQVLLTVDLSCQVLSSLLLGGMIGPSKWSKPMDVFSKFAQSHGLGLAAKRIAFPGKINLSADHCIVSFPGKYSEEWDTAVAVASEEESCSLACVFLTDSESGLGHHVEDPESPNGDCYCKALYGSVPLEAYVSELDLTDPDNPIDGEQLAFRKADAKAMGQMLLIKYSHTTHMEWNEKKSEAMRRARECWQQNQGRAPWGCSWFFLWKEKVDIAAWNQQTLHVFYFEGRVGAGKVPWEELGDEEARKRAREGGGLGASQTAEVAYLDKLGLPYIEHDITDFNSFVVGAAPLSPAEVQPETIGRPQVARC